jgi:transposase
MCPTAIQRNILRQFFGCHRFIYNQCVALYTKYPVFRKYHLLRSFLVFNYSYFAKTKYKWLQEYPTELKDAAYQDFKKAVDSNWAKKKINPNHQFIFKFKSLKAPSDSIQLKTRDVLSKDKITKKEKGVKLPKVIRPFAKMWGKEPLKTKEPLSFLDNSTRLIYKSKLKCYYMTKTYDEPCENQTGLNIPMNIVALDPGICTFQTAVGLDGSVTFYGYEARKTLNKLHLRIDHIQKEITLLKTRGSKYKSKQRLQKIKNRIRKKAWIQKRIKDLVTTLHYETIKGLKKFPIILLPEFGTQEMLKQKQLGRHQKRELQTFSHYTFKQRLIHKCKKYGQRLFIIDESYSTKTCFKCDHINEKVKGRWFKCTKCNHEDHRDINPGKNMLKWYLPKLSTLEECGRIK